MKKVLVILTVAAMLFSMAACGGDKTDGNNVNNGGGNSGEANGGGNKNEETPIVKDPAHKPSEGRYEYVSGDKLTLLGVSKLGGVIVITVASDKMTMEFEYEATESPQGTNPVALDGNIFKLEYIDQEYAIKKESDTAFTINGARFEKKDESTPDESQKPLDGKYTHTGKRMILKTDDTEVEFFTVEGDKLVFTLVESSIDMGKRRTRTVELNGNLFTYKDKEYRIIKESDTVYTIGGAKFEKAD